MKPQIEILDYSEKAVIVLGETKPYKERLKELNGRFNPFLKHPESGLTCAGWVFSKKQLAILEKEFKSETKPEAINETETKTPVIQAEVKTEVPEIIADEKVMKQTRIRQARKTKTETKSEVIKVTISGGWQDQKREFKSEKEMIKVLGLIKKQWQTQFEAAKCKYIESKNLSWVDYHKRDFIQDYNEEVLKQMGCKLIVTFN